MDRLGVITDDLTMTTGVMLAQTGIRAVSYLSAAHMPDAARQEALIISTNSRNLPSDRARERVLEAYRALRRHGATRFTKRIDTTYRGGIGHEIDALLEAVGDDHIAFVVNTLPASSRLLLGGYALIDGEILSETDVAHDVLSPVSESHIPTLLAAQSAHRIAEIHLDRVLAGPRELSDSIGRCMRDGARLIVIDAVTTEHIRTIAGTVCGLDVPMICVDSGEFTLQMAICRGLGRHSSVPRRRTESASIAEALRRVLVIAGSAADATRRQIARLLREEGVASVSLDPERLVRDETRAQTIRAGISAIRRACSDERNRVVVVDTAASSDRLDLGAIDARRGLARGTSSRRLTGSLGAVAAGAMGDRKIAASTGGMFMTGGDTLFSVLRALRAQGVRFIDAIRPQTNLGLIVGGPRDGLPIVGKGGMIGAEDTAVRVVRRLIADQRARHEGS